MATSGNWEAMLYKINEALNLSQDPRFFTAKVGCLLQLGRIEYANEVADKLVQQDTTVASSWLLKLACLRTAEEVLSCLEQALTVNPHSVPLYLRKVQQLLAMHNLAEAEKVRKMARKRKIFL